MQSLCTSEAGEPAIDNGTAQSYDASNPSASLSEPAAGIADPPASRHPEWEATVEQDLVVNGAGCKEEGCAGGNAGMETDVAASGIPERAGSTVVGIIPISRSQQISDRDFPARSDTRGDQSHDTDGRSRADLGGEDPGLDSTRLLGSDQSACRC